MILPKPAKRGPKAKKRVRRQKKTSSAKLAREADRLWSLVVRKKGRCELCGSTERLQGAHGFSRRYRGTRWLPINGWCLDSACHVRLTHDPLAWDDIIRGEWGQDTYDELKRLAQAKADPDFHAIIAGLQAELVR